jgi:prophage regulatory protein
MGIMPISEREAMMESPEYYDSKALKGWTGTKASTWRYWDTSGTGPAGFPPSFRIGRRLVWKKSAVLAWLEDQQASA